MELVSVQIRKPEAVNFILGQTRGAETIDDIYAAIDAAAPHLPFGIAFNEASGNRLVRVAGSDQAMIDLASSNANALGAGDIFVLFFGTTPAPRRILAAVKALPEVCGIWCATSNPTEVILAMSTQGRGIIGVIDGFAPKAIESDEERSWRHDYLHHVAGFRK